MKATCPNDPRHNRFLTTAHVSQTWEVDSEGNFSREVSTDQTDHGPDPDNEWTCAVCQAVAKVERTP